MKNKKTCIIIPTFKSWKITKSTTDILLKNQKNKNFDIIIVDCGSEDYKKLSRCFREEDRVLIIHTEKDLGGSGSFWLGMKYALKKGYKIFILSDNDCIPISSNIVDNIINNIEDYKAIKPKNIYRSESLSEKIGEMHFLGIHKNLIKKVGFPRIEFFIYYDDVEYYLRIKNIRTVDSYYKHEEKEDFDPLAFSKRTYYYMRNYFFISYLKYIRKRNIPNFIKFFFQIYYLLWKFLLPSLISIAPSKYVNFVLKVFSDSLKMMFGKTDYTEKNILNVGKIDNSHHKHPGYYHYLITTDAVPEYELKKTIKKFNIKNVLLFRTNLLFGNIISLFLLILKYYFCLFRVFGKNVLLLNIPNYSCLVTSKNALYKRFIIKPKYLRNFFISVVGYPLFSLLIILLNVNKIIKISRHTYLKCLKNYFDSELKNLRYEVYRSGCIKEIYRISEKDFQILNKSVFSI